MTGMTFLAFDLVVGNVSNYSSRQGWEDGERCPVRGGATGLYSFQGPTSVVPSRPARGQMGL